jgi:hypothetical protein
MAGLLVLLSAGAARADRRELYTVLGYEPGMYQYQIPSNGTGSATQASQTVSASVYYGLTNTWHVGGRVRLSAASNVHIGGAVVTMPDGSRSQGDLYQDHRSFGLGALVLYRLDTKASLAPVLELEGGFTAHEFSRIEFIPSGATHSYPQSNSSSTALHGSAALLVEYRFANRWVASVGIAAQGERGGSIPWGLTVPIRIGTIW